MNTVKEKTSHIVYKSITKMAMR